MIFLLVIVFLDFVNVNVIFFCIVFFDSVNNGDFLFGCLLRFFSWLFVFIDGKLVIVIWGRVVIFVCLDCYLYVKEGYRLVSILFIK